MPRSGIRQRLKLAQIHDRVCRSLGRTAKFRARQRADLDRKSCQSHDLAGELMPRTLSKVRKVNDALGISVKQPQRRIGQIDRLLESEEN